jgi:hypothetical protein
MLMINPSNPKKIAKSIPADLLDSDIGFTGLPTPPGPPGVPGIGDKFFNDFNVFDNDFVFLDLRGIFNYLFLFYLLQNIFITNPSI